MIVLRGGSKRVRETAAMAAATADETQIRLVTNKHTSDDRSDVN